MPEHVLLPGKRVIEAVSALGRTMGYRVRCEWPIDQGNEKGAVVDVAWFTGKNQKFPLMIFEVETGASTGMVNNAVKVFSKTTEQLEKPLFYFHVVLSAGSDNSRVDSLRTLFGTHNYRVYVVNQDRLAALVRDVLTQHRRIRATLDLRSVLTELMSERWDGIDLDSILDTTEALDFRASYLQVYGERAETYQLLKNRFLSFLRSRIVQGRIAVSSGFEYENPLYGATWSYPIHLGIVAATTSASANECLGLLRAWQLESSYMTQIGPHFGLSRDYDEFVVGVSASLWALLAALFKNVPGATQFIAEQMMTVFSKLSNAHSSVALFTAIWLLHVAASGRIEKIFADAARFVNQYGVPEAVLKSPPGWIDLSNLDGWCAPQQEDLVPIRDIDEFSKRMRFKQQEDFSHPQDIAIRLLASQPATGWEAAIVLYLLNHQST
ncbi:MAG TPA: hypothetical protein VFK06_06640 [Candidatus Angelobacter sp.]|nr:hypothetical protein [Candidatus Angelobacter sp.]